jgi:hypothetical protein
MFAAKLRALTGQLRRNVSNVLHQRHTYTNYGVPLISNSFSRSEDFSVKLRSPSSRSFSGGRILKDKEQNQENQGKRLASDDPSQLPKHFFSSNTTVSVGLFTLCYLLFTPLFSTDPSTHTAWILQKKIA